MLWTVDEYQAADAAVELRRDQPDFDEANFREGFSAGYAAGHVEGFQEALDAVNREA